MSAALLTSDFLARLDRLDLLSRRILAGKIRGDRPVALHRRAHSASLEWADWRDYAPGDDPRFIDWNLCARLDRLLIKLFTEEKQQALHLVLDASASMNYGEPAKWLFLKQLAAAVGVVALANRHPVHITTMRAEAPEQIAFRRRADVPRLLESLDSLEPFGAADLDSAYRRIEPHRSATGSGVCVIISDFLFPQPPDRAVARLAQAGHDVFCVQLLSPQELWPQTQTRAVRLIDSETDRAVSFASTPAAVAQYQANLQSLRQAVQQSAHRAGAAYIFAGTDKPFEELVLESLRRHGLFS